jgi:hypothetical protein
MRAMDGRDVEHAVAETERASDPGHVVRRTDEGRRRRWPDKES